MFGQEWMHGADRPQAELKPTGDRLEAKGMGASTKVLAVVSLAGQPSAARVLLK